MHPVPQLVAVLFALLLIALSVNLIARRSGLPFTVLLVLVGMGISLLSDNVPSLANMESTLSISPDLILFVFLPTLIFESSYNLDAGLLKRNSVQILTLAVPGLLLSTGLIGVIIWQALDIGLVASLLLGAILSATDPVAVIALFRQIGAPGRLSTLIEGESLFNDATALVLSKILLGILAAGAITGSQLAGGVVEFFILFAGGLAFGALLGYLCGLLIGWLDSDPVLEIILTTAVAYLAFLIAEELMHVSGIMATLGAGLTLGTWGRLRVSASVRVYMEHFWEVLAFASNALLFLLLGMEVNLLELARAWELILWVVLAMLVSRAIVVFVLLPLLDRVPGVRPVGLGYRVIMFWGGLRGAIALAIVLSLTDYPFKDLFVAMVTGAVLFTLLVQGLTIKPVLKLLKLDQPPIADRLALFERDLEAHQHAIDRLPALQQGGMFSSRIAHRLHLHSRQAINKAKRKIKRLRKRELRHDQELNLFFIRALAEERSYYLEMYDAGHISESSIRRLLMVLDHQLDTLKYNGGFQNVNGHHSYEYIEHWLFRLLGEETPLKPLVERLRITHINRYYEITWGHFQGSRHVLNSLEELARLESTPRDIVDQVLEQFRHWNSLASDKLHRLNQDFPELARLLQERLGKRIVLLAEVETTREQARLGTLPKGAAERIELELYRQLKALRGLPIPILEDDPAKLLPRVPLFARLPHSAIERIAAQCEAVTLEKHDHLIHQGKRSDRLYIVSRGIVRLQSRVNGDEHHLSTLIAGDSFGESALMGELRNPDISVVAQTPARLYALSRESLDRLMEQDHALAGHLKRSDARQRQIHHSESSRG
ncbi:cation:proton antiporter [Marinobacterium sp. YM272]|uniref:cation:proton antiporter n=1 Tax=Marinobacterium sp. YM272 TaxID=3421654 RepID=UPI003D7FB390